MDMHAEALQEIRSPRSNALGQHRQDARRRLDEMQADVAVGQDAVEPVATRLRVLFVRSAPARPRSHQRR